MANIRAITTTGTRVKRIAFGAGDFTLDMNIEWSRTETELLPYRSESNAFSPHAPANIAGSWRKVFHTYCAVNVKLFPQRRVGP
jgi:hypothetical protein